MGGRGSGAVGVLPRVLTFEATLLLHISYVTPKLAHLKYAEKSQTVRRPHLGVARCCQLGTSPRACGWVGNLPLSPNRRRGARHQPLPYWQFLGRTPLHKSTRLRRQFHVTSYAFSTTRSNAPRAQRTCFQCQCTLACARQNSFRVPHPPTGAIPPCRGLPPRCACSFRKAQTSLPCRA